MHSNKPILLNFFIIKIHVGKCRKIVLQVELCPQKISCGPKPPISVIADVIEFRRGPSDGWVLIQRAGAFLRT